MKLNTVLPWVLVVGLGTGLAALYVKGSAKDAELVKLREESTQAEQTRTELAEIQEQVKVQQSEIESLRKGTQELLTLRSEIGKIRDEKEKLNRQLQSAQTEAQRAQAQVTQARQAEQARGQQVASLQTDVETMRKSMEQNPQVIVQQRNMCINNLRQLDGAKQQWALEHAKPADAVPNPQDIAPYLRNQTLPLCPAGGLYTINPVSHQPTCSIQGHALPNP